MTLPRKRFGISSTMLGRFGYPGTVLDSNSTLNRRSYARICRALTCEFGIGGPVATDIEPAVEALANPAWASRSGNLLHTENVEDSAGRASRSATGHRFNPPSWWV